MAGYLTTTYGDPDKRGLAVTLASAAQIEVDQQRPQSATIHLNSSLQVYEPRLVYYHLATDARTGRRNLYRQIRTQPGVPPSIPGQPADEIVAENVSGFTLAYLDRNNKPVDCLFPYAVAA